MPRKVSLMKPSATLVLLVFGVLLGAAWAQKETVLYSFCAQSGCADGGGPGGGPVAGLIFDQKGNLYGTTEAGGSYGAGVVFKLSPKGKETVLYSFCAQSGCADGGGPVAGLIFDQKGNLYGTTEAGGSYGAGVVFKLSPKGKETVLYSFCAQKDCSDGANPYAGVVFDQKGNLYGTTWAGGAYDNCGGGCGVVFRLTPAGKETVIHSFCAHYEDGRCIDGANPMAGLVLDNKGNLYGTTTWGGAYNACNTSSRGCGVVFKLCPKAKETVLYNFCALGGDNCTDGELPFAELVFDKMGNLFGTTDVGGAQHFGVVFKLTPKGQETVLYSFCAQDYCTDGFSPEAGLILDQKGNLYGTTFLGGNYERSAGVVFSLTPRGEETVLYAFCSQNNNCADGELPLAGLVFDQKGNLYGTTWTGGAYGGGVVFKLTP